MKTMQSAEAQASTLQCFTVAVALSLLPSHKIKHTWRGERAESDPPSLSFTLPLTWSSAQCLHLLVVVTVVLLSYLLCFTVMEFLVQMIC